MTDRERAIKDLTEARGIHADWIEAMRAGKVPLSRRRIIGGIGWHEMWVRRYNRAIRLLEAAA